MIGPRRSQKPPVGTPLDRDGYFYSGLVGAWLFNEGTGVTSVNLVTPGLNDAKFQTGTASPVWSPSTKQGFNTGITTVSSTHQYASCGVISALNGAAQATVMAFGYCSGTNNFIAGRSIGGTSGVSQGYGFYYSRQGGSNEFSLGNGTANGYGFGTVGPSGDQSLAAVFDGTQSTYTSIIKCYLNGAPSTVSVNGTPPTALPTSLTVPFEVGGDSLHSLWTDARYDLVLLWAGRALSAPDIAKITSDPWQIVAPIRSLFTIPFITTPSFTLSGPAGGSPTVASTNFTLLPYLNLTDTVTLSDGVGGTFTPSSLSWTASGVAKTFTYTPSSAGVRTITATSTAGSVVRGSPASYLSETIYTATGPSSGTGIGAATFTVTPQAAATDTISLSDGGAGGTFSPTSLSWTASSSAKTFTYTPPATGTFTLTLVSGNGGHVNGSPLTYAANVSYTLTGPTSGSQSFASLAFTITPQTTTTDTISLSDGGAGGTFTPSSLSWTASGVAKTFTYTPTNAGVATITATSAGLQTITGSPASYTSSAIVVGAYVSKWGKLAIFNAASATTLTNGVYPPGIVTAVNSNPTIKVNGTTIVIGPPTWNLTFEGKAVPESPFVAYLLKCGGVHSISISNGGTTAYTSPSVVWNNDGGGTGLVLGTPTMAKGVIAYTVATAGSGYTNGSFSYTVSGGSIGTGGLGAVAWVTVAGGVVVSAVPIAGGSSGCGTVYSGSFTSGVIGTPTSTVDGGSGATLNCVVGNYVQAIPVVNPGSGFTGPPSFTITDSGSGTGATCVPIMTGPLSSDTLTYSAAVGWFTTSLGASTGASNLAMVNSIGVTEPTIGHLTGFTGTPSMILGGNAGSSPSVYFYSNEFTAKNKFLAAGTWTAYTGTTSLLLDIHNNPISWTPGGQILLTVYGASNKSKIGLGTYTFVYDDAYYAPGSTIAAPTTTTMSVYGSFAFHAGDPVVTISGTTVTKVYTVTLNANNSDLNLNMALNVVAPSDGLWHLSNLWLFAPGNTIDRSNRYAVDDNAIAQLTSPSGRTPGAIRFMDSVFGGGGVTNYVDASDIQDPNNFSWQSSSGPATTLPGVIPASGAYNGGTATFQFARYLNTNVASTTYSWSSPRLYSSQAWAQSGTDSFGSYLDMTQNPTNGIVGRSGASDDGQILILNGGMGKLGTWMIGEFRSTLPHGLKTGQFIIYGNGQFKGTVTLGSAVVTSVSSIANLAPGVTVSNANIPGGTTILSVDSSSQVTLSAAATAPATATTFSCLCVLPTTTLGNFTQFTGSQTVFVTGPNTVALLLSIGGLTNFTNTTWQSINSTTEIPIFCTMAVAQPENIGSIPCEYAASLVSRLPNTSYWLNLSYIGNDGYYQSVAQRVAANIGPTNDIILEYGNEHWNSGTPITYWENFLQNVPAYLPTGTNVYSFATTSGASGGYIATNGVFSLDYHQQYAMQAAHAFDVFTKAWVAAGMSASRLKRSYGSQWSSPSVAADIIAIVLSHGAPIDYISVGSYSNNANDPTFVAACTPAGSPTVTTPGNWPVDAINDFYRHQIFYSVDAWGFWTNHVNAIGANPIRVVSYECAVQSPVPKTTADFQPIAIDARAHPSYYDLQYAYYLALQQGNPTTGQPGALLSNYFSLYGTVQPYGWAASNSEMWWLMDSTSVSPGHGSANQYLTSQGGAPGTRYAIGYTQTNQNVGLQAYRDWMDLTSPFYAPAGILLTPAPGASGISARVVIVIQFNEPMLGSTINSTTFTLKQNGTPVAGTVAYNSQTWAATFTPTSILQLPVVYTVQVTTAVTNIEGTALAAPITWSFKTGSSGRENSRWFAGLRRPNLRVAP